MYRINSLGILIGGHVRRSLTQHSTCSTIGNISTSVNIGAIGSSSFARIVSSATMSAPNVSPSIPRDVVSDEWEDTIGTRTRRIRTVAQAGRLLREIHRPGGRVDCDSLDEVTPQRSQERHLAVLHCPPIRPPRQER